MNYDYVPSINERSPSFPRSPWILVGVSGNRCLHRHYKHAGLYRFEMRTQRITINIARGGSTSTTHLEVSYDVCASAPPLQPLRFGRMAEALAEAKVKWP